MRPFVLYRLALTGLAASSFAIAFSDDFQIGGSRISGMGGAGLALPVDVVTNNTLNPALLAFGPHTLGIVAPGLAYRLDGLSTSDLSHYFLNSKNGSFDNSKLIEYGQKFGGSRKDLGADANLGLYFYGLAINGIGKATFATLPNPSLQASTQAGGYPAADARLDGYGVAYYSYGASYGRATPMKGGSLAIGGAAKFIRAYYGHKFVEYNSSISNVSVSNASDVNGNDDLSKSGFGADLGLIFTPASAKNSHFGLVVENLIAPDIKFRRQLPNTGGNEGAAQFSPDKIDLFKTAANVGYGLEAGKNLLFAADILDLGNRAGRQSLATGVELRVGNSLAVRSGYNSRTGLTVGAQVLGFNFSIAGKQPLTVGTQFRF